MIILAALTMANVVVADVLPSPASKMDRPPLIVRKPAAKPAKTAANNALDAWAKSLEGSVTAPEKPVEEKKPVVEEPKKEPVKEKAPEVKKPIEEKKPVVEEPKKEPVKEKAPEVKKPVEEKKPVEVKAPPPPPPAPQLPPPSKEDLAVVEKPVKVDVAEPVKLVEKKSAKGSDEARSVKITSSRADADRKQGVILFDGNVFVDDSEYQMHSDRLYVFLEGTNELKRIVAVGNVAITNDNKMGYCAKATYSKEKSRIIMYGDGPVVARLVDNSKKKSEVVGSKITFWVDSDQVEVENSSVTLDAGGAGMKDQAKKLRNNGK